MASESLTLSASKAMAAAGIDGAELLRERSDPDNFGDSEAIFRLGSLLLRFDRDRGEDFLDLASTTDSDHFYQFGDVEIAMGWRSIESVLALTAPEPLTELLARLRSRLPELQSAMSGDAERATREKLQLAADQRGAAFIARLR